MSNDTPRSITGDILLEAGTNEVEILAFHLCGQSFGVNVAKVREVIRHQPTIDIPHKHPSVIGMIEIREKVLTLIDLGAHLGLKEETSDCAKELDDGDDRSIVITEFNGVQIGFLIDGVDRIHRLSWEKVMPVPALTAKKQSCQTDYLSMTTGVLDLEGTLVLLVDFESVADAVLSESKLHIEHVENPLNVDRQSKRVIVAEDSPFMRAQIEKALRTSGYDKAEIYEDGAAAWEAINADGPPIDAIVSDIEMPRMDGLRLTKLIKDSSNRCDIPVILFSSLISEDNAKKGVQVGASVQIPKPELPDMVRLIDHMIAGIPFEHIVAGKTTNELAAKAKAA